MKENSVERLVLSVNFILTCGIIIATFAEIDPLASALFAATYALLLVGIVAQVINRQILSPALICVVLCAVFCILHTLISIWRSGATVSLSSLATFLFTLVFFVFATHMPKNNRLCTVLIGIGSAIILLFGLAYFVIEKTYMNHGLTFGFTNPNITGMFLMHGVLYALLALFTVKRWLARIPLLLLAGIGVYLVLLTRCRSALVGIAAFAVLAALFLVVRQKKVPAWLCATVIVVPLLFAVFYLLAHEAGILESIAFWEEEGKQADSRVVVWQNAFTIIRRYLFTGDYASLYDTAAGVGQRHNVHIEVLTAYGLIPFILFVVALFLCILPIGEKADTAKKQLPLLAFFAVILAGTFEAGFITGALGLYILSGGFLACAAMQGDEETEGGAV